MTPIAGLLELYRRNVSGSGQTIATGTTVNDPAKLVTGPIYPYPQVARYRGTGARVTLKISRAPRLLIHDSFDIHAADLARSGHVSGHWK